MTQNVDPPDRPQASSRFREAGVDPRMPFPKDTTMVKANGFRLTFESGMVLVGSAADLEERVDLSLAEAKSPKVTVDDPVKRLEGR
ncbi:hypothetical protein KSP35_21050 [Aquihabitans sp. G128]|uniref:hypothetical protein n=1 Tax=Aquihabitans sp. G128 TaxID=2849779 RepID=UPI001C2309EB|nr:hypothetical protein [Aquihabitans sp. G128]QXC60781.1 hypothetical protein KSP35_21050 [Aquihabitans sp. G128]